MKEKTVILMVDDEVNILRSLKRAFIDSEYKILMAGSGKDGLEAFDKHDIQVVVSDYRMPGMTGVEFLQKVKEKSPDTIRIILSGYADAGALVEAINEGEVYKFVAKPWNEHDLLTTIKVAVDQYALQQENRELYSALEKRNEELRNLAQNLEEKVMERTRDLELKNRALTIAQNILQLLPVGVIGVDSDDIVVYMNDALNQYIDTTSLGFGLTAVDAIDTEIYDSMKSAIENDQLTRISLKENPSVSLICTPLAGGGGVIGLFGRFSDAEEHGEQPVTRIEESEGANAGQT
ncbi:MAG: response regulator [candidate division Zixibacteria bacterium]|jgi:two-component system NtrC family sensor kinase|nr:response regulator [candidate division Zixibacteria bacterium]